MARMYPNQCAGVKETNAEFELYQLLKELDEE